MDEKHIGFANGRGTVTVTGCKQSLSGGHSTVTSKDHHGNEVTAMVWSNNHLLFSGDDVGKLSVLQMQNFIVSVVHIFLSFKTTVFMPSVLHLRIMQDNHYFDM